VARDDVQALLVAWNAERLDTPAAPRPDGDARVAGDTETFRVPDCRECGGVLKPRVVFFGENVPRSRVAEAWAGIEAADAVLVVGSSLMVYSGYRFALEAARQGKPVAAVNRGRTRADEMLALKASGDCAELLADAVAAATSRSRGASVESPWEGGRP
jgi:NAD-dependent SIR2 family protein deacetylase